MKIRITLIALLCVCMVTPLLAQGPPEISGPIVVRYEQDELWWGYADFKRGYVAFHGIDIVAACMGAPDLYLDVWYIQDNFPPAEDSIIHTVTKGDDVMTGVWSIAILDQTIYPHWCFGVIDLDPIAFGTADVVITDNDVEAGLWDHNRANAYSLSAHGILFDPSDDEPMVFNGGYNCVWKIGDNSFARCKQKVVLH